MTRNLLLLSLLLTTGVVQADDVPAAERVAAATKAQAQDDVLENERDDDAPEAKAQTTDGAKLISGMSILGNQEAPKSLVIVPWKSSELGNSLGISPMLDDSKRPIDREVFMRALRYYDIRSEAEP